MLTLMPRPISHFTWLIGTRTVRKTKKRPKQIIEQIADASGLDEALAVVSTGTPGGELELHDLTDSDDWQMTREEHEAQLKKVKAAFDRKARLMKESYEEKLEDEKLELRKEFLRGTKKEKELKAVEAAFQKKLQAKKNELSMTKDKLTLTKHELQDTKEQLARMKEDAKDMKKRMKVMRQDHAEALKDMKKRVAKHQDEVDGTSTRHVKCSLNASAACFQEKTRQQAERNPPRAAPSQPPQPQITHPDDPP